MLTAHTSQRERCFFDAPGGLIVVLPREKRFGEDEMGTDNLEHTVEARDKAGAPSEDKVLEFALERYKYILQEIRSLNENFHKHLTLFQALATVLVGAGISLFVGWQSLKISAEVARAGIQSLMSLLVVLMIFLVASVIAGICSWFDYRKEEVALLDKVTSNNFRKKPTLKNFWRWQETYLLLFIIVIVAAIYYYAETKVVPLIR
jgi:hypothetical protein